MSSVAKPKIYKAQKLYHFVDSKKTVPGQTGRDKESFDINKYEVVDPPAKVQVERKPKTTYDASSLPTIIKTKHVAKTYRDRAAIKGWSLSDSACRLFVHTQMPLSEFDEQLESLAVDHPDKGSLSYNESTNEYKVTRPRPKKSGKVSEIADGISKISVSA